jgi:hypothetical protein
MNLRQQTNKRALSKFNIQQNAFPNFTYFMEYSLSIVFVISMKVECLTVSYCDTSKGKAKGSMCWINEALHQEDIWVSWTFFPVALPAHSGPRLLIQFRNHFFTDGRAPWTSDQPVARPVLKHRTTQTQNKRIHTPNIHALSRIRTHDPSTWASEHSSCLRPRGCCDRLSWTVAPWILNFSTRWR